jgi:hypothetical protein
MFIVPLGIAYKIAQLSGVFSLKTKKNQVSKVTNVAIFRKYALYARGLIGELS